MIDASAETSQYNQCALRFPGCKPKVGGIYEVDKTSGGSVTRTVTYYPVAGAIPNTHNVILSRNNKAITNHESLL